MKASQFLTKNKLILESLDTEVSVDKDKSKELNQQNDNFVEPSPAIDTDDDQILAVMNNYFRHINEVEDSEKVGMMGNLIHRMVNKMIEMPGGEKALRGALKGAVNGLPTGEKFEAMKKKNPAKVQTQAEKPKKKNESLTEANQTVKAVCDALEEAGADGEELMYQTDMDNPKIKIFSKHIMDAVALLKANAKNENFDGERQSMLVDKNDKVTDAFERAGKQLKELITYIERYNPKVKQELEGALKSYNFLQLAQKPDETIQDIFGGIHSTIEEAEVRKIKMLNRRISESVKIIHVHTDEVLGIEFKVYDDELCLGVSAEVGDSTETSIASFHPSHQKDVISLIEKHKSALSAALGSLFKDLDKSMEKFR